MSYKLTIQFDNDRPAVQYETETPIDPPPGFLLLKKTDGVKVYEPLKSIESMSEERKD